MKNNKALVVIGLLIISAGIFLSIILKSNGQNLMGSLRGINVPVSKIVPTNGVFNMSDILDQLPPNEYAKFSYEDDHNYQTPVFSADSIAKLAQLDFSKDLSQAFNFDNGGLSITPPQKQYTVGLVAVEWNIPYPNSSPMFPSHFSNDDLNLLQKMGKELSKMFLFATNGKVALNVDHNIKQISAPTNGDIYDLYSNYIGYLDTAVHQNLSKIYFKTYPNQNYDFLIFIVKGEGEGYRGRSVSVREELKGKGCNNGFGFKTHGDNPCLSCFDNGSDFGTQNGILKDVVVMNIPQDITKISGIDPASALGEVSSAGLGGRFYNFLWYSSKKLGEEIVKKYTEYSQKLGFEYIVPYLIMHEVEHYWTVKFEIPKDFQPPKSLTQKQKDIIPLLNNIGFGSHYEAGGQSPYAGSDPHGAFKYDYQNGNLKICLSDMFPFKSAKFHPYALHAMGVDSGLDLNKKYYSVTPQEMVNGDIATIDKVEGDCVYIKPVANSVVTQASIQDIIDFWGPTKACYYKMSNPPDKR